MKKTRTLALLLALALVFSLCACKKSGGETKVVPGDRNGDGKITIGYSAIAYAIAVLPQFLHSNVERECKTRNWDLIFLSAEGDVMKQGEQVQQLVQQDPDYFILFPADPVLAIDWVNVIADAGIPCIALYIDVDESVRNRVVAYCGVDNYDMASGIANKIIEDFGADAALNIVMIGGVPVQTDYIQRNAAYNDVFAAKTNYKILGMEWAWSSRADAQTIMENFISTYGAQIDILIGMDDDLTLGGINALQAAGMTDVPVYSNTGQKEAIAAIKEGKMTLSAFTSTAASVAEVMKVLDGLVAGNKPGDYYHYIETPHITKANADQFQGEF